MHPNEEKIYYALLIAASILAVILLLFVISLMSQYRKNKQLYKEKLIAEITASEKERKKLASDIHDDIGPLLSAAKLQMNSLEIVNKEDEILVENAGKYIDEVITQIRQISNNLLPAVLIRKGFLSAIAEYCDSITVSGKMQVSYHFFPPENNFGDKEVHLYRILHEIIHNCLKHSNASRVHLTVEEKNAQLIIQVKDNGKGFNYKKMIEENSGLGLKSLLSRVELMNGDMYVETSENNGVHYTIEIPL
jgi:signal transduction histidine kinase